VDVQQPGDGDLPTAPSGGSESTETSSVSGRPHHRLAFTRVYREAGISYARGTATARISINNKSRKTRAAKKLDKDMQVVPKTI